MYFCIEIYKIKFMETNRSPAKEVEKLVPVCVHVFKLRGRTCGTENRIWIKNRMSFLENNAA